MDLKNEKLELISLKEFEESDELYKIVDFLNKSLSELDIVFGLTQKDNKKIISIYKEN